MLASRLLLGAAIGIIWGLMPAVVLRLAPEGEFPRSFASVVLGVAAAGVIAAPSAAYLGDLFSWRAVYLGATALAMLATVMLAVWFPSLPAQPGALNRDLRGTLRLPGLMAGMVGVMLMFGGMQTFFGYLVPFLESVTRLEPSGVSLTLLLYGLLGTAGNLVAPRSLKKSIRWTLVVASATMSALLLILLTAGSFFLPTLLALMVWAFARSHVGVGANSWLAHTFPDHLEGAGGILVAVIQGSMMIGAIIGGVLIDSVGARAPAAASAVILAIGAIHIMYAMKPKIGREPADRSRASLTKPAVPVVDESIS
jgi:predicted MFS family arabinose efflux permease